MPGHRVRQPAGRGAGLGPASPAAPFLEPAVEPVHRRRRSRRRGSSASRPPRPSRRAPRPTCAPTPPARTPAAASPPAGHRSTGSRNPPGPNAASYAAGVTSPKRPRLTAPAPAPPQRCFTPRPVVGERGTRMVIGATEHRRLVIRDLVGAHRAEPGHLNSRRTSRHPSRESRNRRLHSCSSSRAVFALASGVSK